MVMYSPADFAIRNVKPKTSWEKSERIAYCAPVEKKRHKWLKRK